MTKLSISNVLLAYEEPLVVVAEDNQKSKLYVGINYDDSADGSSHRFYFAKVQPKHLEQLYEQRIDVRYLLTKCKAGEYLWGEVWGAVGNVVNAKPLLDFSPDWLPQTGMFIPYERTAGIDVQTKTVHIDGRWGIDDLGRFSALVQDAYAFVFALSGAGAQKTKQQIENLFQKYPWRGGFSSVNFFDDLYRLIPAPERAQVKKIKYASPGTIELRMSESVAQSIRVFVENINDPESSATEVYNDVRSVIRAKGWLGKAKDDLELKAQDNTLLLEYVSKLAKAFKLDANVDEILVFADSDPLGAVKILLAYYRRLAGLADYVATGKAQELFV